MKEKKPPPPSKLLVLAKRKKLENLMELFGNCGKS
jgi:hypothetical protein